MKTKAIILAWILWSLYSGLFANFSSSIIDPAMMTNYLPDSKVSQDDPDSISRNFQAQLIKQMFLQPSIGDQLSLFKDDEESMMDIQSDYATEMIMHHLAQDLAKKDLFKLNKILTRGLSAE